MKTYRHKIRSLSLISARILHCCVLKSWLCYKTDSFTGKSHYWKHIEQFPELSLSHYLNIRTATNTVLLYSPTYSQFSLEKYSQEIKDTLFYIWMNTNTLFFSSYSASEMTFLKHSVWKKSCLLPYFSFISFILNPHREARRFSLSGSPGKRFQFVSRTQNLKGQKVVNLNKDHCYTQVFLMHSPSVTVSKKAKQRKNVKQCSRDNSVK